MVRLDLVVAERGLKIVSGNCPEVRRQNRVRGGVVYSVSLRQFEFRNVIMKRRVSGGH